METRRNAIPITDQDLDLLRERAEQFISRMNGNQDLEAIMKELPQEEHWRILPVGLDLLYTVRRSTCLYLWFTNWLFERTGQKEDAALNLAPTEVCQRKQKFSSTYALWVMANYILVDCERLLKGKPTQELAEVTPKFTFDPGRSFGKDLQIIMSYYADILQSDNQEGLKRVKHGDDLVSITKCFWKCVADKAEASFPNVDQKLRELIQSNTFHYNEFIVQSFKIEYRQQQEVVAFSPVQPEDVVGNDEPLIQLLRIADRIGLYDLMKKQNPFCEIGGLVESTLLDGPPGTGKTMLIRAMRTRLAKRAEQIGLRLVVETLDPASVKSEWYGRSSKQLQEKLDRIIDPSVLGLLIADDIDLMFKLRDAGGGADNDLLKGLMDFFSGVGALFRGNYTSVAATNKPTGTDDALRQRFIYRVVVRGPQTAEDFADMAFLQLRRATKFGIANVSTGKYAPMSRKRSYTLQADLKSGKKGSTWGDIGNYITEIRKADPFFTARSVKNAIDVVMAKASDFEIPEEWYTNPAVFRTKSWDDRVKMIRDLYSKIDANIVLASLEAQFNSELRYQEENYLKQAKN